VSMSKTVPFQPSGFRTRWLGTRLSTRIVALAGVLTLAFAIRATVVFTQTYVLFVDETFQYLEQGHRLAFGSGLVPWEFQDGARSWLLPGVIAALMRLSALMSADPIVYLRLIRLLCVTLSLAIVLLGFRAGERRAGLLGGIIGGGFCAIWFDPIWFAPAVLTEVIAAHFVILAIYLDHGLGPISPRRQAAIGALFGLAVCLRYQYVVAIVIATVWRCRLSWLAWRWVLTGGAVIVAVASGVLDALTWGKPFQSIWLNVLRNSVQGVSAGMGIEPADFYIAYLDVGLRPMPLLAVLAVVGAMRMPALALAAAVTLLEHSLVPHKEVRFIYLTIAAAPILIGLGITELVEYLRTRFDRRLAAVAAASFLLASACLSWWTGAVALGPRWQFERANMLAFLAAHREPELCGLAVRDVWFWETGGYTYLHRDVPLWFADYDPGRTLPGVDRKLDLTVMRRGRILPQITGDRLGEATHRYSHMIAKRGNAEPGYSPVACFDDAARHGEPEICLFRRPGGCE
jgi:GPI mannosyltransferase 3